MTSDAQGWDCHAHLFGPYDRYPLAADRSYTPPEAVEAQYLALLARLGLARGVLVQPSAYGDDFRLLFDALAARPQTLRGVIVARSGGVKALGPGLRGRGVRAARYSHRSGTGANFAGSASFDDLLAMTGELADAGLHAELWTDCKVLPDIASRLERLPFPVVIDHMGGFDASAGIDGQGLRALLQLLERGKVHVKLCAYRNLLGHPAGLQAGRPFHEAMLEANPERLLWGSDWPHLRVVPAPDAAELLAVFRSWTLDETTRRRILVDNPQQLYG